MAAVGKGIKPAARITPVFSPLQQGMARKSGLTPMVLLAPWLLVGRLSLRIEHRRALVLVAVVDAPARDVVRRDLETHAIAGEDADAMLAHASAGVGEHARAVLEFDAELRVRQHFLDGTVHFQHFFLGQNNLWRSRERIGLPVVGLRGPEPRRDADYTCSRSQFLNALTAGRSAMTSGQTR